MIQPKRNPATNSHLPRMPQQSKSSNIRNRMPRRIRATGRRNQFLQSLRGRPIQSSHRRLSSTHRSLANLPLLQASSNHPSPNSLSQNQNIASPSPKVLPNFPRINQPGYRITKFQFLIPNRMPPQNRSSSLTNFAQPPAQNLLQQIRRSPRRKSHNR